MRVHGTRLPCGQLGWLRVALSSCALSRQASEDYLRLERTSTCSDRNESVSSFLSREPEPEPEPCGGHCLPETTAVGAAVGLAVGFLAVGLLAGCCLQRKRAPFAGRLTFRRADSRHMQTCDDGISLPLQTAPPTAQRTKADTDTDRSHR